MSLKRFFNKILDAVLSIWKRVSVEIRSLTMVAIDVVNAVKDINESTTGDIVAIIIKKAIPSELDDIVIDRIRSRLKDVLPKVILKLNILNALSHIEDPNEQLKYILNAINISDKDTKKVFYHDLCVMIIDALSDKKITWSETVHIAEYIYENLDEIKK